MWERFTIKASCKSQGNSERFKKKKGGCLSKVSEWFQRPQSFISGSSHPSCGSQSLSSQEETSKRKECLEEKALPAEDEVSQLLTTSPLLTLRSESQTGSHMQGEGHEVMWHAMQLLNPDPWRVQTDRMVANEAILNMLCQPKIQFRGLHLYSFIYIFSYINLYTIFTLYTILSTLRIN